MVHNIFLVEETREHCLDLAPTLARFFRSRGSRSLPMRILRLCLRVIDTSLTYSESWSFLTFLGCFFLIPSCPGWLPLDNSFALPSATVERILQTRSSSSNIGQKCPKLAPSEGQSMYIETFFVLILAQFCSTFQKETLIYSFGLRISSYCNSLNYRNCPIWLISL